MRSWIPALRIAKREAKRAKGRSALVLAMIGLPVALLAFAAVSYDTFKLTAQEKIDRTLGTADALITWQTSNEVSQSPDGENWGEHWNGGTRDSPRGDTELLALLPPGTRLLPVDEMLLRVRTPNGIGNANARVGEINDPLMKGTVSITEGAAPVRPDEVAINAAAARWLGLGIGGTVKTVDPDRYFTVTGIIEYPADLSPTMAFPLAARESLERGTGTSWLVDTPAPIDWASVKQLNKKGIIVASRTVILDPPAENEFVEIGPSAETMALGGIVTGLAILEIILLAGPAFAVGARRRSRDLALVAAAGGEPKQLRRIVLADGVVLGVAGAIVGVILGIVAAVVAKPLLEEYFANRRAGDYRFYPWALLGIGALAVVTGLLAAMVPAFTAARQDVVRALTGRRGIVRSRKRWVLLGLVMTAIGAAIATFGALRVRETVILTGIIIGELGLVLVTPALVGLVARTGRWLPLAPRLALRDTARNRASAAPAISAVMAAVAGAVLAGVFLHGEHEQSIARYQPMLPMGHIMVEHHPVNEQKRLDWTRAEVAVRKVLPDAEVHRYLGVTSLHLLLPEENRCPYLDAGEMTPQVRTAAAQDDRCRTLGRYGNGSVVVDEGPALYALTGVDSARLAQARQVLARGGAVVSDRNLIHDGRVTFEVHTGQASFEPGSLPTISVEAYYLGDNVPGMWTFLSPKAVADAKLASPVAGLAVSTTRLPTQAEQERLALLIDELGQDVWTYVEKGPRTEKDPIGLMLAAVAAVIALGAAGIATGLTAADSRADLGTLAAVGASPGVRRRLSLSQAGVISGLGALLGTLAGLGAGAVLIFALNRFLEQEWIMPAPPMPFGVPWDIVAVILAVPLIAMAGAGLLTRSRLPIERRI